MVGAVVAAIVLGGAIGQGVAAAGADDAPVTTEDTPIVLEPDLGAGPTTEDAPDPADAPGPLDAEDADSDGTETESSAKLASFSGS